MPRALVRHRILCEIDRSRNCFVDLAHDQVWEWNIGVKNGVPREVLRPGRACRLADSSSPLHDAGSEPSGMLVRKQI